MYHSDDSRHTLDLTDVRSLNATIREPADLGASSVTVELTSRLCELPC